MNTSIQLVEVDMFGILCASIMIPCCLWGCVLCALLYECLCDGWRKPLYSVSACINVPCCQQCDVRLTSVLGCRICPSQGVPKAKQIDLFFRVCQLLLRAHVRKRSRRLPRHSMVCQRFTCSHIRTIDAATILQHAGHTRAVSGE